MSEGILYLMTTVVNGLIKIGKTENYESRMKHLENNGYFNVSGLKRSFAIKVDNYEEKETMLHNIFSKSQIGNSELFSLDIDLARQLLSSFDGEIVYPKEDKEEIFINATDLVDEKSDLNKNRHHFKEINFKSSLTNKEYHGKTAENGVLEIIDINSGDVVPNTSKPSKKQIIGQAIVDLGGTITKDETLYQRYHKLTKIVNKDKKESK